MDLPLYLTTQVFQNKDGSEGTLYLLTNDSTADAEKIQIIYRMRWKVEEFCKVWKESVVFVLEDDAQNGPNHVDAHRSPAFVISPYVKRKSVNHNMYSTSGMLRTMELILGLPPMSQYDAAATPLWECFNASPDLTSYKSLKNNVDLKAKNIAINESSRRLETFNLAVEDAAPDNEFSEVIWKTVKGENSKMPAPRRSTFIRLVENDEESE